MSHPFLYKRVRTRWQRGSPFKSVGIPQFVLRLFLIVIEAILTPLLLPLGAYAGYRDQRKYHKSMMTPEDRNGAKNNSEKTSKDRNKGKCQSKDLFGMIASNILIFSNLRFSAKTLNPRSLMTPTVVSLQNLSLKGSLW